MKTTILNYTILFLLSFSAINGQEIINLYPSEIPNSKPFEVKESVEGLYRNVTNPTLEYFKPNPKKATGTAIILIPGGGYSVVVYQGEGVNNAKVLAEKGVAAFVLKYRLPNDEIMPNRKIGPLQDAQQAVKLVRENAEKWNLNQDKIGVMGFSAGGHLASTAATHFEKSYIENSNNTSLRPDFQILIYPVISMTSSLTHDGSRNALIGKNPSKEDIQLFSNELQVDTNTPIAYLTHAADDTTVDVDNSIEYFEHLRHKKVNAEMHIYPTGGHGFIFKNSGWIIPLFDWMKRNQLINE